MRPHGGASLAGGWAERKATPRDDVVRKECDGETVTNNPWHGDHYVLGLGQEQPTRFPFVGFSLAAIRKREVLETLIALPSSIFELYTQRSRAGYARMYGAAGYRVQILDPAYLNGLRLYPRNPFNVFVSDAETYGAVEQYVCSSPLPVLHVGSTQLRHVPDLRSVTRDHIRDLYARVMDFLQKENKPEMVLLPRPDSPPAQWVAEDVDLQQTHHGVTIPNEMALQSLRFQLAKGTPLPPFQAAPGGYATAPANLPILRVLQESVVAVRAARARFDALHGAHPMGAALDAIVWSPALTPDSRSRHDRTTPHCAFSSDAAGSGTATRLSGDNQSVSCRD